MKRLDPKNVIKFLEKLEEEYPDAISKGELREKLGFSKNKFKSIDRYLKESGHVEREGDTINPCKITSDGIEFLREEERKEIQDERNKKVLYATWAIVGATLVSAYLTWNLNSAKVGRIYGTLGCPQIGENFEPTFSNSGNAPGAVGWSLDTKNLNVSHRYEEERKINVPPGDNLELGFNFSIKNSSKKEALFNLSYTKPSMRIPFQKNRGIISCEYEKEDEEFVLK